MTQPQLLTHWLTINNFVELTLKYLMASMILFRLLADGTKIAGAIKLSGFSVEYQKSVVFQKIVAFLLVDQEICCTFAVALFGNVSEKAV